jgi:hypothetical protein
MARAFQTASRAGAILASNPFTSMRGQLTRR